MDRLVRQLANRPVSGLLAPFFSDQNGEVERQLSGTYIPLTSSLATKPLFGSKSSVLLFGLECALGIISVVLTAALAHWSEWLLPVAVLLYLLIVVPTALLCGFWQAVTVSLSAVVIHIFFTARQPAINAVADPANSVTLVAFVLTALVVSRLSASVTRHAQEAKSWGEQMHDLYEFSRRTLQMNLHMEPGPQLAELIHEIFALEAVVVFDADLHEVYQAGYWGVDARDLAQNAYFFEKSDEDPVTGIGRRVLRLGAVPIGSVVLRGDTSPLTNDSIASLIAISFDRYRAYVNESNIEAEHRTEQLRTAVLDSLAHAYKTPLTAIRAASTGLGEMSHLTEAQSELVALTGLLNDLTTRLLATARLNAREITIHATSVGVGSLIEEAVTSLKDRLSSMKVAIELERDDLSLCCDRQLMIALLTQYIDNACKYSTFGTTIAISVVQSRKELIFSVHSYGPVIPVTDRERIFDRYYRSSTSSNSASGTGIGLSVSKRIARVHGGHVWVTSDEEQGTKFYAAIPTTLQQKGSE
jgi:two-component system, OmpR family, sensor histidine kinase KdpD